MQIINKTSIEVEINGRIYEFICNPMAPLGEIHDAICQMRKYVIDRMVEAQAQESKGESDK